VAQGYVYDDSAGWRAPVDTDLPASGVTAATYGDATHVSQVTVNAEGIVTAASNVPIGGGSGITDLTSTAGTITVTTPTGPTTNVDLPSSGVVAGTYGSSSNVAQVTVNAEGIVTAAANVSIGGGVVVGADGWVDDTAETWTFASFAAGPPAVGTFTVSGDLRSKYTVGTRVKLTQTTIKYFVVSADPTFGAGATTVTISGGTDYTLANAAISANNYSYVVNPQGYPGWFNFAPGASGWTAATVNEARFSVVGRTMSLAFDITGTSNSVNATAVMPLTGSTNNSSQGGAMLITENNSIIATSPGRVVCGSGSTTLTFQQDMSGASWTNVNTKRVAGQCFSEV